MLAEIIHVEIDPVGYKYEQPPSGVELHTLTLCVERRLHVSYTLKVWSSGISGVILHSGIVAEPRSRPHGRAMGSTCSCPDLFDLAASIYGNAGLRPEEDDRDLEAREDCEQVLAQLREADPNLMVREFYRRLHEDGDGHDQRFCNGKTHFVCQVDEYGMPGFYRADGECDHSCRTRSAVIPAAVLRHLRKSRQLIG